MIPHVDPWKPVRAPLQNAPGKRSPEALRAVLAQFDVVTAKRYLPTASATYCNIFAWDATSALGAEIPHWVGGRELNANATLGWLESSGPANGWREVDELEACGFASLGKPAVAIWRNPTGKSGHVAVLLPPGPGTRIAQAGATNLFDAPLAQGFGKAKPIRFFAHE
jgi:hypothetical protein